MVELVEIDVVGAQPPEGGVDGIEHVLSRSPAVPRPLAHRPAALGGHDELVAAALEPAPHDLLGATRGLEAAAHRVDVGGVEERDAARRGAIEDRAGRRLVALQAEGHGAETEARDGEAGAAEADVAHAVGEYRRAAAGARERATRPGSGIAEVV